jgi:hypothetical protein
MARTKADHVGTVRMLNSLAWIKPIYENTETANRLGCAPLLPAIDATGPDGRRWLLSFESEIAARFDGTSRENYIKRMRNLAQVLITEADRMEQDPRR